MDSARIGIGIGIVIIYGLNPVLEALRAGRVRTIRVADRDDRRMRQVFDLAARGGVSVHRADPSELDRAARGGRHQGVIAEADEGRDFSVSDLVAAAAGPALLVVLDGVEDAHNFGAILRVADAAGADGVIRQTRRSAALDGVTAKASAGALAHVRVASVVNIARALEELREANVWTVGLAGDAPLGYTDVDLTQPSAVVLGAEGSGLRRLVRERCDLLAALPMRGHVDSLNVSVAAGIVLFEALRQRGPAGSEGRKSGQK